MRRLLLPVLLSLITIVPLAQVESATATSPHSSAAPLKNLVVKTATIGGRQVRFILAVDTRERTFVLLQQRLEGRWSTVGSDRTQCKYYDGSRRPGLAIQQQTQQVLVGWQGPGGDQTSEYGGYNIRRKTIEMFGADRCTAAG